MSATLKEIAATSRAVRATTSRREKEERLAALFTRLEATDLALAVSYLSGEVPQGALGVGWKTMAAALEGPRAPLPDQTLPLFPATSPSPDAQPLTLTELDGTLSALAGARGAGSARRALAVLRDLLARTASEDLEFLIALLRGELRQGALRAVVRAAVARALDIAPEAIARAEMFGGDLAEVAAALRREGQAALVRFAPRPMVPIAPMLARTAATAAEALAGLGAVAAEIKLDGVRIQLHKDGPRVRVFTRQLRDVSANVPEIIALGGALAATSAILDGEALLLDEQGRPLPFQDTMSRVGREDASRTESERRPLTALFFDLLYQDGTPLIDHPGAERWTKLSAVTRGQHLVSRVIPADLAALERFFAEALAAGHEGVVVKALAAPYSAGRRGGHWRKLKPATTLDLVILAAEWGHGRRHGLLSNLHLGARDAADPARFWMLGKTFKGLTDDMLREMTADLLALATDDPRSHVVRVRPERVVEIAFDALQRSSRYDSGLALRFARVRRFRPDKTANEATTLEEIREIHRRQIANSPG